MKEYVSNSLKYVTDGSVDITSSLVQMNYYRLSGSKPLYETTMAQFSDAYMHQQTLTYQLVDLVLFIKPVTDSRDLPNRQNWEQSKLYESHDDPNIYKYQ